MGTVAFANLPALSATTSGNMYNISDQFVTTSDFKEGAGNTIPAGANVYKTEDGKWDVLAGTPVTGVKGSAESAYRRGDVNITAENVGAVPVGGNAGSADRAARLGRNGNAGYPMTFNWAGKDGQPSWLWGGENGEDMYVYNPSNFSVNYAASAGNAAKVNGHNVNADVPSDAKFTDTKGTCLSGRSSSYGWSVNRLPSDYLIEAFHTAAKDYSMTSPYGNMYWASFEITIPQSNNIKFFDAINITPFATSGLISVSITNYTTSKIQGFVFSPLAETKSISFHVTLHGTAS